VYIDDLAVRYTSLDATKKQLTKIGMLP